MTNEIAVLMAAGKGERMRPITEKTPKPLVRVNGTPMIETVIAGLNKRGVKHIYVVVGYLGEQFGYLTEKYRNLSIIKNDEYTFKNNISSLHAAIPALGKNDCFVCEADLYIPDPEVFSAELDSSCYFGRFVPGYSSDWVFTQRNERIVRIGKGGTDKYNMCGISFFKANDIKAVADAISAAYSQKGHEQLFWDEIVDSKLDDIYLTVKPILSGQITEIDTVEELKAVDPIYKEIL